MHTWYLCQNYNLEMQEYRNENDLNSIHAEELVPSISVDCIILGFEEGQIKILLNKFSTHSKWMLPGGFVYKNEDLDSAANRVLYNRTKIKDCYLQQFYTFGETVRTNIEENKQMLKEHMIDDSDASHWFLQRFISVGYYALVDLKKVKIAPNSEDESQWFNLSDIPDLYSDHNKIVERAIHFIRMVINYVPIGLDLLPEKFTMSELRVIYEILLDKKIDRRNFQRNLLSRGVVYKLDEVSKKWGMKETTLYSFDRKKYMDALENGIPSF